MLNRTTILFVILTAVLSIQAISSILDGQLDLGNLYNYANPEVPDYVFSEEVHQRDLTDEIATLGRVLFYEKQLSLNSSLACAGCHKQEFAFGDTTIASPGFDKKLTERHSTRLVNLNFSHMPEVFWDRRAGHLDSLPLMVLSNSIEMGFSGEEGQPDVDSLVRRVAEIDYYAPLFELAYDDKEVTADKMNLALTQFVRSIVSYDSKYDVGRAMVDSNTVDFPNFTALENQGKRIFQSPFGKELTLPMTTLIQGPQGPVGPVGGPIGPVSSGSILPEQIHPQWASHVKGKMGCADCHGIDNFTSRKTSLTGNNGIIEVLHHPGEIDTTVKRSPSLRDLVNPNGVEIGPFMHDGSIATLEGVMDHYAEIGFPGNKTIGLHSSLDVTAPNNDFYTGPASGAAGPSGPGGFGFPTFDQIPHFLDPRIDDQETDALIAFLKTLSGTNIYTNKKWSDPFGENGELVLTNDCQPRISTMEMTLCEGEVYEGFHTTGLHERRLCLQDGCDSIVSIDLTVMPAPEIFIFRELCQGESLFGYDEDIQTITMKSATVGCDTIVHLDLRIIRPQTTWGISQRICDGQSYHGFTEEGFYRDTLESIATGCDSIVMLNLWVTPPEEIREAQVICQGENMYGYTADGIHIDTIKNQDGCNYLRVLDLVVLESPETHMSAVICEDESYEGYSATGQYTDWFLAENGCDSVRTLDLLVNRKTESLHEGVICAGETFMGYDETGSYMEVETNAQGCDSLIFIELIVNEPTASYNAIAICEGDSYEGYSAQGEFLDVLINARGCDSMRTIDLTILEHTASSYEVAICAGESFEGYDTEGTYTDVLTNVAGCDSTRQISIEVLQPTESYEEVHLCAGEDFEGYDEGDHDEYYTNSVGCDSIRYISIVNIAADDPICSNAFETTPSRITDTDYIRVGPNPVVSYLDIQIDKPSRLPATLKIINAKNQLISEQNITDTYTQVDCSRMEAGVYIIYLEQDANVFLTRLVKL